jgi:eukaryotic-like serine/threonine-protein kinase
MRCDELRLERILRDADEESAEFRAAVAHIESCQRCRHRLGESFLADAIGAEACDVLREYGEASLNERLGSASIVIAVESLLADDNPVDCDVVSLDFLEPAGHPELLGRIGRYDVERMIGAGGMGVVLKGFDTELHRVVAIKVLAPRLAASGAARRRFTREAQAAAAVVHEHVIPIYNVETDGELPYLVMQFVPGKSLQARVDENGPLDTKDVLRIARQAAAGLGAAHAQGLVHRDVKPANILLEESVDRVLLSDFGLARTVDDATLTRTGILTGTPHYMSPEQAEGQPVDRRSDLFSLGSVIYFMCTGRPPFRADSPMAVLNRICHEPHRPIDEVNPDVPTQLADIVDRLLAKDPAQRFATVQEVEARCAALLADIQQGRRMRQRTWLRRMNRNRDMIKRVGIGAAAAILCIGLGAGLARWWAPQVFGLHGQERSHVANSSVSEVNPGSATDGPPLELLRDTFSDDLRETKRRLQTIEARQAATGSMSSGAQWQRDLEAARSMLSRDEASATPQTTYVLTEDQKFQEKD